jgi:sortase A
MYFGRDTAFAVSFPYLHLLPLGTKSTAGRRGCATGCKENEPTQLEKQMFMKLEIPAIDLSVGVVQGTTPKDLRIGPGWYRESDLPGQGNTAIAGHLNIYGSWFRNIHKLEEGYAINLTFQGTTYVYQTEKVLSIASDDWTVIQPVGYNALSLTTCDPKGRDHVRVLVRARLIE